MKQGKPLQRKTPLKTKTPMNRGNTPLQRSKSSLKRGNGLNGSPPKDRGQAQLKRTPPVPKTQRGRDPRPARKPLKNKPPKVSAEERATRKLVEARSDGFCEKCGTPGATDKAHRVSRGVGGGWEPSNILDLCNPCHRYNHQNPTTAYNGGWHLRTGSTPHTSPVYLHHEGTFGHAYLDDDGGITWAKAA